MLPRLRRSHYDSQVNNMQVTLTQVNRYTTKQDGTPLTFPDKQTGQPKAYTSIRIKCQEYGDKVLSGFGGQWNANWAPGMKVDIEYSEKPGTDRNGNAVTYYNFRKPNQLAALEQRVIKIEQHLGLQATPIAPQTPQAPPQTPPQQVDTVEYPEEEEITPDQIPF